MKEYFVWLAKLLTLVVVLFVIVPSILVGVVGGISAATDQVALPGDHRVAVIDLDGMIMDSKEFIQKIQHQIDDKSIKGVIVRINSPGGAVGPSQEIYAAIDKLKSVKPIIAVMGSVAASGGLYAALGASKVYAQPGTMTGSIGVIIQIPNLTKIANQLGFEMITVKSGKLKDVGNTFREMTDADRELLQSTVDNIHQEFVSAVAKGRNLDRMTVNKIADGRILTGRQALELKLVDNLGGIIEAGRAVFEILGQPLSETEQAELVYPEDKFEKFRKFFEAVFDIPVRLTEGWTGSRYEVLYLM